jgi:hypothetical protein
MSAMEHRNTLMVLRRARDLITPARHWCKGDYRRVVGDTRQWCAVGAVQHASDRGCFVVAATFALGNALPPHEDSVENFNDFSGTTHADVLALFDRAIAETKRYIAGRELATVPVASEPEPAPEAEPEPAPIPEAEPEPELVEV